MNEIQNTFYVGLACGGVIGFFLGLIPVCVLLLGKIRDNFLPGRLDEPEITIPKADLGISPMTSRQAQ